MYFCQDSQVCTLQFPPPSKTQIKYLCGTPGETNIPGPILACSTPNVLLTCDRRTENLNIHSGFLLGNQVSKEIHYGCSV